MKKKLVSVPRSREREVAPMRPEVGYAVLLDQHYLARCPDHHMKNVFIMMILKQVTYTRGMENKQSVQSS